MGLPYERRFGHGGRGDDAGRGRAGPEGCGHRAPVVVDAAEGGQRARCLACGAAGPVRGDAEGAWAALVYEPRRH